MISFYIVKSAGATKAERVDQFIKFDWDKQIEDNSWMDRLKYLKEKHGRKS